MSCSLSLRTACFVSCGLSRGPAGRPGRRRAVYGLASAVLALALGTAQAASLSGRVLQVGDGEGLALVVETGTAEGATRTERLRLRTVEPPPAQRRAAREQLARLALGRGLRAEWFVRDRQGRPVVARMRLDNGADPALELLRAGLARQAPAHAAELSAAQRAYYRAAEDGARAAGLGLWAKAPARAKPPARRPLTSAAPAPRRR